VQRNPWELQVAARRKPLDRSAADRLDREELVKLNIDLCCEHGQLNPDRSLWQEVPKYSILSTLIFDFRWKQFTFQSNKCGQKLPLAGFVLGDFMSTENGEENFQCRSF
jgi:hypothetical protein